MIFIINGMKYDTDKMQKIAEVKKWYKSNNPSLSKECLGTTYNCELWKSKKGNWLLTYEGDYHKHKGEAIKEREAKDLLMYQAYEAYEKQFGNIPEA